MSDIENRGDKPLRDFGDGMRECAELLLDSLWQHEVKPRVAALFTRRESHEAAQRAGTDVLNRLAHCDPRTDEAYAEV